MGPNQIIGWTFAILMVLILVFVILRLFGSADDEVLKAVFYI